MLVFGATCAVLAGTLLAAILLLGRFVVLALGFFLAGSALITVQTHFFADWQNVILLATALMLIVVGRPEFARRKRVRQ